jgi:hypothetical protein
MPDKNVSVGELQLYEDKTPSHGNSVKSFSIGQHWGTQSKDWLQNNFIFVNKFFKFLCIVVAKYINLTLIFIDKFI